LRIIKAVYAAGNAADHRAPRVWPLAGLLAGWW
jgi:hypothetical protein